MSEEVKDPAIERAWEEVFALCKGKRWTMHIPAEETDSDFVVSAGLQRADALVAEVRAWRYLLWIRHGHTALYGDDGEMQCSECHLDFKRDPVEHIMARFTEMGRKALVSEEP